MPQSKQIFFDPDRKRWRRLRLVLDTSVIVITVLVVFFVATIIRGSSVPGVPLPRSEEALSRSQGKPEAQAATPAEHPPQNQAARIAGGAELRRRHSWRVLRAVGRGQLRVAEGILSADRSALSRVDACPDRRRPAAGGHRTEHALQRDGRQGQTSPGGRKGDAFPQGRKGADRSPAAGQQLRSHPQ